MSDEPDDETTMVPRVLAVNLGISFFEESQDPIIVFNAVLPGESLGQQLAFRGGLEGMCVVPLAFDPASMQELIPQIIDASIRARVVTEMITIYPEKRDEIIRNIAFRWTGQVAPDENDSNGS